MDLSTFRPAMRSPALARLIGEVADLTTAEVCDRYGARAQVVGLDLRPFGGRRRFCGPARTLRCRDHGLPRQLLGEPGTGSVLVADGGGSRDAALLGDRLATVAAGQGWAGVVVHGAVRDAARLATVTLGVMATTTTPRRAEATSRGAVDVPVVLGGVVVHPGDVVVADADGVVVLAPRSPER